MAIFESLSSLGVPVHPLRFREKAPVDDGWQSNPNLIPTCDPTYNIGLRTGATIGMKNFDLFVGCIDADEWNNTVGKKLGRLFDGFDHYLIEKSGGHHGGRHLIFTSHMPLPSSASSPDFPELYGYNNTFGFRNICITPSIVKTQYEVFSDGHYYHDDQTILDGWKRIIDNPIPDKIWLKLMKKACKPEDLHENLFIFACIPLIVSEDFNYKFFGSVLSGMAQRSGFPIDKLQAWTTKLFNALPAPDKGTVEKILKFQADTVSRADTVQTPGFPVFEEMLKQHIPKQRGNTKDPTASVIFYKELFAMIFGSKKASQEVHTHEIPNCFIEEFSKKEFNDDECQHEDLCEEENILTCGSVNMLYGVEGSMKTWACQDMCVAASKGESFWGDRYTFKEPTNALYVYGDKSRQIHRRNYLTRYVRAYDKNYLKFIHTQNLAEDMRGMGYEPFTFDLSDEMSFTFLDKMIKETKSKLVILDTMGSLVINEDMSDVKFAKKFMSKLRKMAIQNNCCIIMIHHSNKQTTKETRGKSLSRDDFQGSKQWSAQADWTISIHLHKEKKLSGHVRIQKNGMMDQFENFDYEINNKQWVENDIQRHIVEIKFMPPEEEVSVVNLNKERNRLKILKHAKTSINSVDLRKKLGVNRSSGITPSIYKNTLKGMIADGLIKTEGHTVKMTYEATIEGLAWISKFPEGNNDISAIPTD